MIVKSLSQWALSKLLEWAAGNLTQEKLEEYAQKTKDVVIPWIRTRVDQFFADLSKEAKKTETLVDDTVVSKAKGYVDALMPDTELSLYDK